jgi:hypothetical protein
MGILDKLRQKQVSVRYPSHYWPSVVVLMSQPQFPAADEVLSRAQRAWGNAGPVRRVGTIREGASYALQAGPLYFSVHFSEARYGGVAAVGDDVLQRPWNDHQAWMSVDLPNQRNEVLCRSGDLGSMYKTLLVFVFLSWSNNCLGVYFPAEGVTIPNFGKLAGCFQWGRRAGLDLSFLD